ncbi:MAG: hypothetical protein QNJ70_29745 [Xenococcaceae cyanobacterium MO_207.B15]|nr:hypothetical protein [Xenococcaceae cyanobacterium MO_207.B15]
MSISKQEAKQLLERMIFEEMQPSDWVQDVWDLSAIHGESAAKLLDAFEALIECSSQEKLENFVQSLYLQRMRDEG